MTIDPQKLAISDGTTEGLGIVLVNTIQGSQYIFPDMPLDVVRKVLPESGRILESQPTLALVNASFAILSIPFRIIDRVMLQYPAKQALSVWSRQGDP